MITYQLFSDSETRYERRPATIGAAREYARFLVQAAPVSAVDRYGIAESYGWDSSDVSDAIKYEEYQRRRAALLFPDAAREIAARFDAVNVEEVAKAEANFTRACGIQVRAPAVSFDDLSAFLTQALSATPQIRVTQEATD